MYLFPYTWTIHGQYVGIGNDFEFLYYRFKPYLLDCLSHGHLPLWSPSEGAGFPFYSDPFTQTFYPANVFLTVFYRLAGGYSQLDHQPLCDSGNFHLFTRSLLLAEIDRSPSACRLVFRDHHVHQLQGDGDPAFS